MNRASSVYPSSPHYIPVVFDTVGPSQAALFRTFRRSFGEKYANVEDLYPPHHRVLHLLPGGAWERAVRNDQEAKA